MRTHVLMIAFVAGCGASPPHSIAEAVSKRHDEFPANSYVLVPPGDLDRLGETVEQLDGRRARPTGTKCFAVAPSSGHGLTKIELSYVAGEEFQTEVKELAAKAGAQLKNDDKATVALNDLKLVEGFGVPLRGTACGFVQGRNLAKVVTATVVAGTAKIEFSRNFSFTAQGSAGWGAGSASGSGGVNTSQSGTLQGTNIVVVGAVTPVTVTLVDAEKDLGASPSPGAVVTFPAGFDGNVRVDALRTDTADQIPRLTITANSTMSASAQNVPAALKACPIGQSVELMPGTGCFVWNQTGASGVNIWFEKTIVNGADHIIVHAEGYSTTFTPTPSRTH
ncbi:MAG: hypothetical protein JO257_10030 [Deltaproteobacteria bacterium]|nr:hypothetical protein [Deltaproteobacteria bacterium]